jgi:integrase
MTTTASSPSTVIAIAEPVFTHQEQLALAGFLAGYTGLTREAYALDLRQYANWCQQRHLHLFQVRRADIECFARDLEARGRARATVTRRLCTIAGFYRYAVEEDLLEHSPAAHVRRPRLDYESHATGLDRNELGALLVRRSRVARRALARCAAGLLRATAMAAEDHWLWLYAVTGNAAPVGADELTGAMSGGRGNRSPRRVHRARLGRVYHW